MLNQNQLNNICDGFENIDRATAIKKLIVKGHSREKAIAYYNTWRRHYVTTLINIT